MFHNIIFYFSRIPLISQFTSLMNHRRKRNDAFDNNFFGSDEDLKTTTRKQHKDHKKDKKPFCPSIDLDPEFYCSLISDLPLGCMQENMLELFKFDVAKLENMDKNDIIDLINSTKQSPWSGHEVDFEHLLGGTERDDEGRIVAANSLLIHYMLYVNFSESDSNKVGNLAGTEDGASESTMLWENEFINVMSLIKKEIEEGGDHNITVFYSAGRR